MTWWHWLVGVIEFVAAGWATDWVLTKPKQFLKLIKEPVIVRDQLDGRYYSSLATERGKPEAIAGETVEIAPGVWNEHTTYRESLGNSRYRIYTVQRDMWGGELVRTLQEGYGRHAHG